VLIASLLNVAFFNTVVRDVFQHTIPDGLIARFAAATGTNVNGTVAQVFDKAFVDAMAAGVKMADMQSGWSAIAFARAGFIYFIYLPLAALAIFATFAVVFVVMASLGLAVTVGPIFLAFLGFPATRRFFDAWLATIAGLGLLEGMAMLALGIMLGVETTLVKGVLTMNTNDADSGAAQIISLVAAVAVYALFAFELKQLQPLSVGMMSGAYQQLSGIGQRMMGTPIAAAGAAAASGAKAAAGAVGRSAGLISPPGRPARP
jgi:type IV secretion system protein VirB6